MKQTSNKAGKKQELYQRTEMGRGGRIKRGGAWGRNKDKEREGGSVSTHHNHF